MKGFAQSIRWLCFASAVMCLSSSLIEVGATSVANKKSNKDAAQGSASDMELMLRTASSNKRVTRRLKSSKKRSGLRINSKCQEDSECASNNCDQQLDGKKYCRCNLDTNAGCESGFTCFLDPDSVDVPPSCSDVLKLKSTKSGKGGTKSNKSTTMLKSNKTPKSEKSPKRESVSSASSMSAPSAKSPKVAGGSSSSLKSATSFSASSPDSVDSAKSSKAGSAPSPPSVLSPSSKGGMSKGSSKGGGMSKGSSKGGKGGMSKGSSKGSSKGKGAQSSDPPNLPPNPPPTPPPSLLPVVDPSASFVVNFLVFYNETSSPVTVAQSNAAIDVTCAFLQDAMIFSPSLDFFQTDIIVSDFICSFEIPPVFNPLALRYSLSVTFELDLDGPFGSPVTLLPTEEDLEAAIAYVFNDNPLLPPGPTPTLTELLSQLLVPSNPYASTTEFTLVTELSVNYFIFFAVDYIDAIPPATTAESDAANVATCDFLLSATELAPSLPFRETDIATGGECVGIPVPLNAALSIFFQLTVNFELDLTGQNGTPVGALPTFADLEAAVIYVFDDLPLSIPPPTTLTEQIGEDLDVSNPYASTTSFEFRPSIFFETIFDVGYVGAIPPANAAQTNATRTITCDYLESAMLFAPTVAVGAIVQTYECSGVPVVGSNPLAIRFLLKVTFVEDGVPPAVPPELPTLEDLLLAIEYVFDNQALAGQQPPLTEVLETELIASNPYSDTTSFDLEFVSSDTPINPPTQSPITTTSPVQVPTQSPTTTSPVQVPTQSPTTTSPVQVPPQSPTTTSPVQVPTQSPTTTSPVQVPTQSPTTTSPVQVPTQSPTTTSPVQVPTQSPITNMPTAEPANATNATTI